MSNLKIDITIRQPGFYFVSLSGPLDSDTYTAFENEIMPLLKPSTRGIVLNMSGVHYVSSLGIGAIFKINNFLKQQDSSLIMINLQPKIKNVLDVVKALPKAIFSNIEELDHYINEVQRKFLRQDQDS